MSLIDDDTPMDGPGEESQLYCKPIGVDADDASDGDGADASDAGDPRLILNSHRALDAIGGFVPPTDLRALSVVSKTARDSRVLAAIKRVVTQRWTACATSKRARRRLEAVNAMGRFLGPSAEDFLTAIFRDDKLQTVRAAAATWLARVARHAGPVTKQRIFNVACERYDAESGCMNVRQAIERSFPDVYDCSTAYALVHLAGGAGGGALAEFVAATLAAREDQLRRQREASKAAAAGVMGGKIHLFREDGDLRRVHFKVERGGDDSVKLAFANPLERSVLLRLYESRGLRQGNHGLEVVEIPPQSVRHFATIEFPTVHYNKPPMPVEYTYPETSTVVVPQDRWALRVSIEGKKATETHTASLTGLNLFSATGLLRLEARLRQRDDPRGVEHCGKEPPLEL